MRKAPKNYIEKSKSSKSNTITYCSSLQKQRTTATQSSQNVYAQQKKVSVNDSIDLPLDGFFLNYIEGFLELKDSLLLASLNKKHSKGRLDEADSYKNSAYCEA